MRWWMLLAGMALGGCEAGPTVDDAADLSFDIVEEGPFFEHSSMPVAGQVPPPNDFLLIANTRFRPGSTAEIIATGLTPSAPVQFGRSFTGSSTGGGPCPPQLGGLCLDLLPSVKILLNTTADANGTAYYQAPVPDFRTETQVWLQAVAPDGANSRTSTVIAATVDDDWDDDGVSLSEGDCDDEDPTRSPLLVEVCGDNIDNDCDDEVDNASAWFDQDWPYRVEVEVSGSPTYHTQQLPFAVDVDFDAMLLAQGDTSGLDPSSIRVVYQDCGAGTPVVPSEFADGLSGLFERGDVSDPMGDGHGAVVFLHDRTGDYSDTELLAPGASWPFAIYFGSNDNSPGQTAPAYSSGLSVNVTASGATMANARSEAVLDAASGGVTTSLGSVGRPSTGAMSSTAFGNGILFGGTGGQGGWVSATSGTGVSIQSVHEGSLVSVVESSGTASNDFGGFDYSYTWIQFDRRPEVYARVRYTLDRASNIGPQQPFWGKAVRPFMVDNNSLRSLGAEASAAAIPDYDWAYSTYDTSGSAFGFGVGYRASVALRSRPIYDATGNSNAGRYLGLVGQDAQAVYASGAASYSGTSGEVIVDDAIIMMYPYEGQLGGVASDFYGSLDGASATLGTFEVLPSP